MTINTTRRAVLAGAASLPALAAPAIASEPDPIFSAIERHKAALNAFDEGWRKGLDDDVTNDLLHAENDALNDLLLIAPTTLSG